MNRVQFMPGKVLRKGAPAGPAGPAEQLKAQAINEFLVFGLVAASTLSAGRLCDRYGWATLNLAVVRFLVLALLAPVGTELKTIRLREVL